MHKNSFTIWIAFGLALGATAATGVVHGLMSNRWGPRPSMQAAAGRLQRQMPPKIGNWVLHHQGKILEAHQQTLQCAGYLVHYYDHVESGAQVSVVVLVGPHGPTAVHTPEICFATGNHTPQGEPQVIRIDDAKGGHHELWDQTFRANNVEALDQRVLHAWSSGGEWQAAKRPRYEYAGAPYLYKIQLSGPAKTDASEFDACQDFLKEFLAELAPRIAEPGAARSDRS